MAAEMAALCLALLGDPPVRIPGDRFELAWTHSIEKTEWREEWIVEHGKLRLALARIKGTGAGMEPPEEARLEDGWWVYRPDGRTRDSIQFAASGFAPDHRLCIGGRCRGLAEWVARPPGNERPVEMSACP